MQRFQMEFPNEPLEVINVPNETLPKRCETEEATGYLSRQDTEELLGTFVTGIAPSEFDCIVNGSLT